MARKKAIKIPSKTTMNLYQPDTKGNNVPLFVLGVVGVLLVAFLVSRFGVVGRLQQLETLRNEVSNIESQVAAYNAEMEEYPSVKKEHIKYSDSYATDSIVYVDRIKIIDLIERSCEGLGTVSSITITDNVATIKVATNTLSDFEKIKSNFSRDRIVSFVTPISSDDSTVSGVVSNVCKVGVEVSE